jgi:hypothetical protein
MLYPAHRPPCTGWGPTGPWPLYCLLVALGRASQRGLYRALPRSYAARQFAQTEHILEGLMHAADHISVALYVALGEAKTRAVAEGYARSGAASR